MKNEKVKPKVYIVVEGGVVQSVLYNIDNLNVEIVDWDNAEQDDIAELQCERLSAEAEKMPYEW